MVITAKEFVKLPLSAQALYFHLLHNADDECFTSEQVKIAKKIGATTEDLVLLASERFVVLHNEGCIVIKNSTMRDYLQKEAFPAKSTDSIKEDVVVEIDIAEQMKKNFDYIYNLYPKKGGRTKGYQRYKSWITTGRLVSGKRIKLTNRQIWFAIKKYIRSMEEERRDIQYYKNFETLMGDALLDYVGEGE